MSPTIKKMALLLHNQSWQTCPEPVAALQPEGSKPPLFVIATPGADAIGYAALAHALGTNQPLYLIQTTPAKEQAAFITPKELSDLVGPYITAIRSVQDGGPYHLFSICLGAHLAFDIAKELKKSGESIGFLGILDSWAKHTMLPMTSIRRLRRRLKHYTNRLQGLSRLDLHEQLREVRKVVERKMSGFGDGATKRVDQDDERSLSAATLAQWHEFYLVKPGLSVEKYDGCVTLIARRGKQRFYRIKDLGLGWGQLAARVEIQMLSHSEDHTLVFREPYVRELADRIKVCLEDNNESHKSSLNVIQE